MSLIIKSKKIFGFYLTALARILSSRRLLSLLFIPYLIGIVLFALALVVLFGFELDIMSLFISTTTEWIATILGFIDMLVKVFLAGLIAILGAFLLSSWFMELLIEKALRDEDLISESKQSLISIAATAVRGLKDEGVRLFYMLVIIILSLLTGFIPILFFIPILLAAFSFGFDLIDLPMALMELRFKERWRIILKHKLEVLIFGGIFSISLLVPLGALFMMPIAYYAAVLLIKEWKIEVPLHKAPS